jgi:hypothetical protein
MACFFHFAAKPRQHMLTSENLPPRSERQELGWERMRLRAGLGLTFALFCCKAFAAEINDYPTEARAEYVFACMKSNGETPEFLQRCSCSIDVIASLLDYDRYVAAATVASMNKAKGQIGAMFRDTAEAKEILANLRRAEAEAEIRCF